MNRTLSRRRIALMAVLAPFAPVALRHAVAQTLSSTASPVLPATITDVNGDEIVVVDVSRIIPLNGNIAETIFALGLGGNVVATDVSALYPEEAVALPKIGYQYELNAEGIISMEPTVVIGDAGVGPQEVIDQVRAAGITVVLLPLDETIAGPPALIRNVGTALGVPEAGEALAGEVEATLAEVDALVASAGSQPRVAFLYIRGQGTQMMAGANTSADVVISAAGGVNAGADSGIDGYVPVTSEALVEAAPDAILLMQGGLASVGGVDGLLTIPGIAQTPAGENGNIIAFEDLYLLGFGPRIGDAMYDLALALHPELDGEPRNPQWQGTDVAAPEASPAS